MNCEEAARCRSADPRAELPADVAAALHEHEADCRDCRRLREHAEQMDLIIAGAEAERPELTLTPDVQAEVRRERLLGSLFRIALVLLVSSMAAAGVVLAVWEPWKDDGPEVVIDVPGVLTFDASAPADVGENPSRAPLRELLAAADVVVRGKVMRSWMGDVKVHVEDVLRGPRELLDGPARVVPIPGPGNWTRRESVVLFLVRDPGGLALHLAPVGAGRLTLPIDDWMGADVLRAIVDGRAPAAADIQKIVADHGARRLADLAEFVDVRELTDAAQLDAAAKDTLVRLEKATGNDRAIAVRDLTAALRFSEATTTADRHALEMAQKDLFETLPLDDVEDLLAIAQELRNADPTWARITTFGVLDRAMANYNAAPKGAVPRSLARAMLAAGDLSRTDAWAKAREALMAHPDRESTASVLAVMLDMVLDSPRGPDPGGVRKDVVDEITGRIRGEQILEEKAATVTAFAPLLVRLEAADLPSGGRSATSEQDVAAWLEQYVPTITAAVAAQRARFLAALETATPDSFGAQLAGPIRSLLDEATAPRDVAYLLRCHIALGGSLEDVRDTVRTALRVVIGAPDDAGAIDLVRTVAALRGTPVLMWLQPSGDEVREAAYKLVTMLL